MRTLLSRRPSPSMLVALLALIAALVGTAVAGKSVLDKPEKRQVRKLARSEIQKAAPGLSVASAVNATNAASAMNAENADAVDGVSEEELTRGRSQFDASCNPDSTTFEDCVGQNLTLPREARALIIASGGFRSDAGGATGTCRLEVDDDTAAIPDTTDLDMGEIQNTTLDNALEGFSRTTVTSVLPAGSHSFELSCRELSSDIVFRQVLISVVMIGSD
jgi:hypothetical protein